MKALAGIVVGLIVVWVFWISLSETKNESGNQAYWPHWRGPQATGVSPTGAPPVKWNENKNVRWKTVLPGKGHATPIIWGDTIFVTTAIPTDREIENPEKVGAIPPTHFLKFQLMALDRKTGSILWQRTAREQGPHEGTHATATWASNSPVTDGNYVYAHFGSFGLYCYDMNGNLVWEKDLGDMSVRLTFGEGSSPVLHGDKIVILWDHQGQSFIVALNKNTGEELWKVDRDEETSWSSPIVVEHAGKAQVITSATNRTRSYDLETGNLIWDTSGVTLNAIPSPVASEDLVFVMSGFRGNILQAIRFGSAKGDITDSKNIAWEYDRDTPYVPSPLLYGNILYFLKSNSGVLSCFDATTGKSHYGPKRLEGIEGVYASPVGANNRVYLPAQNGTTMVIERGPEFKILAQNSLPDAFDASPAIVGKELYLRGHKALYCIAPGS
ncbi:MAG: PQQ-binding-like beta-propeller repeat protein [Acidobacteriia bacterium]|nr:PQQ-binding-like beta-propeller repeat protein [Terriglobia bacterium]